MTTSGAFFGESALLVVVELMSKADVSRGLTAPGGGTEDRVIAASWLLSNLTLGGDGCTTLTTFGLRGCSEGGSGATVI